MAAIAMVRAQLVPIDDAQRAVGIVEWKEDFVQAWVALRFVEPVDELLGGYVILAFRIAGRTGRRCPCADRSYGTLIDGDSTDPQEFDNTLTLPRYTDGNGLRLVLVNHVAPAGASLALTMAMDGNGNITLTGSGGLSMIVPFEGNGNITFTGSADLRGRCSMQGEWTPYTELSPENLARAVWDALATQFNETGTMGSKLNTASSGGVDMGAMVDAVLAALNATTIPTDVRKVNGDTIIGHGIPPTYDNTGTMTAPGDPWRPA